MALAVLCPAPAPAREKALLQDDFEAGLDGGRWRSEEVWGRRWSIAPEAGALSPDSLIGPDGAAPTDNRFLDLLTRRSDFGDALFCFDARFDTWGNHKDHRLVYLRAQDAGFTEPVGYDVHVGVWVPFPEPGHVLRIRRRAADGRVHFLTEPVPFPWETGVWYRFKLSAQGPDLRVKVWKRGEPEPADWTLAAHDPDPGYPRTGAVGFGNYWSAATRIDNVRVTSLDPGD